MADLLPPPLWALVAARLASHADAAAMAGACRDMRCAVREAEPAVFGRLLGETFGARMGSAAQDEAKARFMDLAKASGVTWKARRDDEGEKPPAMNGAALARMEKSGALVLFGGSGHRTSRHSNDLSDELWLSRDEGMSWTRVDAMGSEQPEPRWGHTLTAVSPTSAVLLGGFGSGEVHTDAWVLTEHSDGSFGWVQAPPMSESRAFHSATFVRGWLVVAGGLGDGGSLDTHSLFHVQNGTWTPSATGLVCKGGSAGHFCEWLDAKNLLVMGGGCGRDPSRPVFRPDVYWGLTRVLEPMWGESGDAPTRWLVRKEIKQPTDARCAVSAALGNRGVLYWGGNMEDQRFNRHCCYLDLSGQTWHYRTLPPARDTERAPPREGASAFPIPGGLRILGGASFSRTTDFSVVWDLSLVDGAARGHPPPVSAGAAFDSDSGSDVYDSTLEEVDTDDDDGL